MPEERNIHSLAIVEDDGTVGPAVVVGLAEVGEDSHTNSLQSSLVTEGKAVAADLVPKHRQEEALREEKLNSATTRFSQFPLRGISPASHLQTLRRKEKCLQGYCRK